MAGEPPPIQPDAPMITRVERIVVAAPPAAVMAYVIDTPLEDQIPATQAMPGVTGTTKLTPGPWGGAGARRIVHLSDGSSVTEQILARGDRRFGYQVWDYTTPAAAGVAYALGEFRFTPQGAATEIAWTYSFHLRDDGFPGLLGPVGRWLMRVAFLDRGYAGLMRASLAAIKRGIEEAGTSQKAAAAG